MAYHIDPKWQRRGAGFILYGLLLVSTGATTLLWPTLAAGDRGTWLGAISTFFTLVAALWIAVSEHWNRKTDELALARVVAEDVWIQLPATIELIGIVLANLEQPEAGTHRGLAQALKECPSWSYDEIAKLLPIQRSAASMLSRGMSELKLCSMMLGASEATAELWYRAADYRSGDADLRSRLKMSTQALEEVMALCDRFLHESGWR